MTVLPDLKKLSSAEVGFGVDRADADGQFRSTWWDKSVLDAHPEITAIMCGNDQIAVGAITALNLAERKISLSMESMDRRILKRNWWKKTVLWQEQWHSLRFTWVKDAAKIALAILKDNEYEPETYEEVYMINSDNVEMYGVDGWQ